MSDDTPDQKCLVSSLPNESVNLVDFSPGDKPWDEHRKNADVVSDYYGQSEFQNYSDRVRYCAEFLLFKLVPENQGVYKLTLESTRFCRVRHCPVCQWRRSLMWKAKAYKVLPKIIEDYPKYRWLFLTLTVKNCNIADLREILVLMNKAFKRLSELKAFPGVGWLKTVEVTRGKDGSAHPHFHCLLIVKPGYFGKNYIKHEEWVDMWKRSLQVDYNPVLDVQAIKKDYELMQLIPELLKYCTKESDLTIDKEWFLELTRQMYKMRAIVSGGVLKEYLHELEKEPEDLVGENSLAEADEGHLYFGWKREKKKYKLVDH